MFLNNVRFEITMHVKVMSVTLRSTWSVQPMTPEITKMASERDPCIVYALTTLVGVLSPLARAVSNSMEGIRGT